MTETIDTDVVCFDLDDTLCTYSQDADEVLSAAFERAGVAQCWDIGAYYDRYRDYLTDSTDILDLRRQCFGDLSVASGHDRAAGEAVADAFEELRDQERIEPLPGARQVVDQLAGEYRLGLITNGPPKMQRTKLEAIGLDDRFETVVCAGYDTAPKPAAEPFDLALEQLESTPERAVYIGNSLSSDVAGARTAGLRSVWIPATGDVPPEPTPEPTHTLGSLEELATLPW
ncbi:HAD-superfamily hydrolase [Natrialba chahannaoensis JCM 10990]|uniref:HAD-superfamily hydrolase n=1 Tax=Natrialba chahannaoensis JCM 10990 TaxID=1227492 RepID=M0AJC0_9EURY|nr:HAD family hydrolase [Natrialba chahannaoensis]ELY97488.1 HAD-superfamily hydrolase [Natrialba chahannaoensis JCM 10990]